MQTIYGPSCIASDADFTKQAETSPLKAGAAIVLIASLAAAVAIEVVKLFGLAHGMDEHTRLTLSWVGLSICFVAAPSFLIFGRNLSMKTGFALVAGLIFVVSVIASMVA